MSAAWIIRVEAGHMPVRYVKEVLPGPAYTLTRNPEKAERFEGPLAETFAYLQARQFASHPLFTGVKFDAVPA